MALQIAYKIYDPWSKTLSQGQDHPTSADYTRRVKQLAREAMRKQKAAGISDFWIVCAINRQIGIHRWFNISVPDPELGIRGHNAYAGATTQMELLCDGEWRIATPQEREKAVQADDDERAASVAQHNTVQMNKLVALGTTLTHAISAAAPVAPKDNKDK